MVGSGVLAIWNNCAEGSEKNYENWYQNEHLPERLGVPGFVRGRRYQSLNKDLDFFTWYEVDTPETLRSSEYKKCLANPTPWTRKIMSGVFLNASRTVCRREIVAGETFGSAAVTFSFEKEFDEKEVRLIADSHYDPATTARVELWVSDEKTENSAMAEEAIRGQDTKIAGCLLLEFLRDYDAVAVLDRLKAHLPQASGGIFRLLCERSN